MQRGSRSSKNLLASSSGWGKDAHEPQVSAAEVSGSGTSKVALAPPVAGESSSVFLLRESWLEGLEAQRITSLPRTLCLQAHPLPPWVQQALFKILQPSHQSTLGSVLPVQVWVPAGLLLWRWFTAWTESLWCSYPGISIQEAAPLRDPGWPLSSSAPDCSDLHELIP